MVVGCCRKKMLLQVIISYKALFVIFCAQPCLSAKDARSPFLQTLSWFMTLFCVQVRAGGFQLKGVPTPILERWPWDPPSTGEDGQRWWCSKGPCFELGSTTSRAVRPMMQPELSGGATGEDPSGLLLFLFVGSRCLGWKHYEAKLDASCWTSPPGWTESLLDFEAVRQIRLPSAYSKGRRGLRW